VKYSLIVFAKTFCSRQISGIHKYLQMKKLSIEQLETTRGSGPPRLRTCFIAGLFTTVGVGIGFGSGSFYGAGAALLAGLTAANYRGCL
jgi:hypothetical protein